MSNDEIRFVLGRLQAVIDKIKADSPRSQATAATVTNQPQPRAGKVMPAVPPPPLSVATAADPRQRAAAQIDRALRASWGMSYWFQPEESSPRRLAVPTIVPPADGR